jgi:hypothetical protein
LVLLSSSWERERERERERLREREREIIGAEIMEAAHSGGEGQVGGAGRGWMGGGLCPTALQGKEESEKTQSFDF